LLRCSKQEYIDLADVRWMREKWRELMARTHGDFSPPPYRCTTASHRLTSPAEFTAELLVFLPVAV
jgi:hypothetical protein